MASCTNDGDVQTSSLGTFTSPAAITGNDLHDLDLIYNLTSGDVECFYDDVSMGTVSIGAGYDDLTRVVVNLTDAYSEFGEPPTSLWGQLDVDDIRIANTPPGL